MIEFRIEERWPGSWSVYKGARYLASYSSKAVAELRVQVEREKLAKEKTR